MLARDEWHRLNIHFRVCRALTGLALAGDWLAVGHTTEVSEYVDDPPAAARLGARGRHFACYRPHSSHFAANITQSLFITRGTIQP